MEPNKYEVRHIANYEIYAASPDRALEEAFQLKTLSHEGEWTVTLKEQDDEN